MDLKKITYCYFIGIGGIGMSALARYFQQKKYNVAGYDKTNSPLTGKLEEEGIDVHYQDLGSEVLSKVGTPENTLVVWTPAVPTSLGEYKALKAKGYTLLKRAKVLGMLSEHYQTLGVAGTHGKTTTSTLLAHVLRSSSEGCNAFLGGISSNFHSNLLVDAKSKWMVVEADEFDRSFHQLTPFSAIITSTEADHLNIYHDEKTMLTAFDEFANLVAPEGSLILHHSVEIGKNRPFFSYGITTNEKVDFRGLNVRVQDGHFVMDVVTPTQKEQEIYLGLPGVHNVENALAVIAICETMGLSIPQIRAALHSFRGVKRRFDKIVETESLIYIDDYAHHPTAIRKLLESVRLLYPNQTIHTIFQPHLYSRTQDFMDEFAAALKASDETVLMPIYPARELPIEGITSEVMAEKVGENTHVFSPEEVLKYIETIKSGVILTVGAGNIDRLVTLIQERLS